MAREIHVSKIGSDKAAGTKEQPFLTISRAAKEAWPGDTIIVHEGEYREWVKPAHPGISNVNRIIYEAAEGEKVVIKGSERMEKWDLVEGTVWKTNISNRIFGDYNPYESELFGDWFLYPYDWHIHTGDVYLNGKSFYEARTLEDVTNPVKRTEGFNAPWTKRPEAIRFPEDTIYQWWSKVTEDETIIYANFHEYDPNKELVEINVRKCCFYPDDCGINYITVRGFEMAHAATPWAPPTGDQPGLLGPKWSKGWIIENNIIHDAKCSGISLGKEASTGDILCTRTHKKPGYQYQMESVFQALMIGWSKEHIGSHIVRNNSIYDCGQNGIVGHMGGAFSEIYGNHIYNIAVKHEFYGYEIAGIKLHAAIDIQIHNNNLHNTTLGIWLDWQAQGSRISGNLFYNNDRDLFLEVTHGPQLVDHNLFLSEYNFDNAAHGSAYIGNLCCGTMRRIQVLNRATPYHYPHSTIPMGTTFVYGGDDRWYQNVFVGGRTRYTKESTDGTVDYNGHPASLEEYTEKIVSLGCGDLDIFEQVKQPVYIDRNVYRKKAGAYDREVHNDISAVDPMVEIAEKDDGTYLTLHVDADWLSLKTQIINSADLGVVRIAEQAFENPDGSGITFDMDYLGKTKTSDSPAGPFAELKEGKNTIRVWGK